jgi:type IV secretory pathway TraG/TraD family ATPase VirD4
MISTALAIQNATGEAVTDFSTLLMAKSIASQHSTMTDEEFSEVLFNYSAHLASLTASLVTSACLTEAQLNDMIETIKEMDSMGKDIE